MAELQGKKLTLILIFWYLFKAKTEQSQLARAKLGEMQEKGASGDVTAKSIFIMIVNNNTWNTRFVAFESSLILKRDIYVGV